MLLVGLILATTVFLSQQQPRIPDETNQSCGTPLDRGDSSCSSPNKTMRWYYDSELDNCFEYFYEGCGGGQNTFYTRQNCRRICIPADKGKCGGNMKPTGTCERFDTTCPAGSTCDVGPMGAGICCDDKNEESWRKERNPTCESGSLSMRTVWWGEEPRLGRNCSHKFCPDGYKCVQGKRLAHCCGAPTL
ncbi:hypothetical protein Aduo_000409 [Ancylostoma duodenale]